MPRRLHPFIVPVRALKEQLKSLQTSFQFLPDLIQHNPFHLGQPHQVISLSKIHLAPSAMTWHEEGWPEPEHLLASPCPTVLVLTDRQGLAAPAMQAQLAPKSCSVLQKGCPCMGREKEEQIGRHHCKWPHAFENSPWQEQEKYSPAEK